MQVRARDRQIGTCGEIELTSHPHRCRSNTETLISLYRKDERERKVAEADAKAEAAKSAEAVAAKARAEAEAVAED